MSDWPTPMSPERLAEIKDRADQATSAPWKREGLYVITETGEQIADCEWLASSDEEWAQFEKDADFIAAARQDVPALLAEIERLKALWAAVAEDSRQHAEEARGRRQHGERLAAENQQLREALADAAPKETRHA